MILYGAGGHAKVICEVAESCGDTVKLIVDDDPRVSDIFGIPVTANKDFDKNIPMVIAVGNKTVRKKSLTKTISILQQQFINLRPFRQGRSSGEEL